MKDIKYYPLTSAQNLLYLQWSFSFNKAIVDISSVMYFDSEIDPELMQQAIYLGICRNKSTFTRLHKFGKEVKQYFTAESPETIECFDYSDSDEETFKADIEKWSKIPFPNKCLDTQLYKVRFIKMPNGKYCASFVVSHLAFDAYSLMMMASDITHCYVCLRDGLPIEPSEIDPTAIFEEDFGYNGSEKMKRDIEWWTEMFRKEGEPRYTNLHPAGGKGYHKNARTGDAVTLINDKAKYFQRMLSAERVEKVNKLAKEMRVSPQVIFMLALRNRYLISVDKDDDFFMLSTIARRSRKVERISSGTRVAGIQVRLKFSNELSFREACSVAQQRQINHYRHGNLPVRKIINILHGMYNTRMIAAYNSVNMTYQPYYINKEESLPVHFTFHSNGSGSVPVYLTIMAVDNSGELLCNYEYMLKYYNEDDVLSLHAYIEKFIDAAYEDPDKTLFQLMEI